MDKMFDFYNDDYKVLFALPALESTFLDGFDAELDSEEWYDFEFCYQDGTYRFNIETMLHFDEGKCIKYINKIFDNFTLWMNKHNYDTSQELNMYQVFTEGINITDSFQTIEDAYATFKFTVKGFNGEGL